MSITDKITVMVLTFDEAPNIERTLRKLTWAPEVLVVDSGSQDGTLDIVRQFSNTRIISRAFDSFAGQCNFGLSNISTEWVLSIDADYELSHSLVEEVRQLEPEDRICGYTASFIYRVYGRPLRGTLYPPRTVLYRRTSARYHNEGHGHRVSIEGDVTALRCKIFHDDRKPLGRWFRSQQRYAEDEAAHLLGEGRASLSRPDRIRRMAWPAPFLVLIYTLIFKGCIWDGWPGWFYALQRASAETMIALAILDQKVRNGSACTSDVAPLNQASTSSD